MPAHGRSQYEVTDNNERVNITFLGFALIHCINYFANNIAVIRGRWHSRPISRFVSSSKHPACVAPPEPSRRWTMRAPSSEIAENVVARCDSGSRAGSKRNSASMLASSAARGPRRSVMRYTHAWGSSTPATVSRILPRRCRDQVWPPVPCQSSASRPLTPTTGWDRPRTDDRTSWVRPPQRPPEPVRASRERSRFCSTRTPSGIDRC